MVWVSEPGSVGQAIDSLLLDQQQWQQNPKEVWGLSTGFPSWDRITGGLHPGEETVIGARTSHGKTALVNQVAFGVAQNLIDIYRETGEDRGKILVFNPEMDVKQLMLRYISSRTGIPTRKVQTGKLDDEEEEAWQIVAESARRFDPFVVIDAGERLLVTDLIGEVKDTQRRSGVALVIVDYLGLIQGTGKSAYERATDVSQRLKNLTHNLGAPLLVLSQVKRPEKRFMKGELHDESEERPTMHDLRDSGDIEQSADNVLMLFNPPNLDKHKPSRIATLYVDKQRNGPNGAFSLSYIPRLTRFEDLGEVQIDGE